MAYRKWFSASGAAWPFKDEFEVGCTLEHAGYYITLLSAFFGPARTISAFSSALVPDKEGDTPTIAAPDFSVACITFASGVTARLTCSIVASHNHSLRIFGDEGILCTDDCWNYRSPVYIKRMITIRRRTLLIPGRERLSLLHAENGRARYSRSSKIDFCRGISEMASAISERRACRLSARYSLHTNEVELAIQHSREAGSPYTVSTTFDPIEPMSWAIT